MKINKITIKEFEDISLGEYERIFKEVPETEEQVYEIVKALTDSEPRSWKKKEYDAVVQVIRVYINKWNNLLDSDHVEGYHLPKRGDFTIGQLLDALQLQKSNAPNRLATLVAIATMPVGKYNSDTIKQEAEKINSMPAYKVIPLINFFLNLNERLQTVIRQSSTAKDLAARLQHIGRNFMKLGGTTAFSMIWHPGISWQYLKLLNRMQMIH